MHVVGFQPQPGAGFNGPGSLLLPDHALDAVTLLPPDPRPKILTAGVALAKRGVLRCGVDRGLREVCVLGVLTPLVGRKDTPGLTCWRMRNGAELSHFLVPPKVSPDPPGSQLMASEPSRISELLSQQMPSFTVDVVWGAFMTHAILAGDKKHPSYPPKTSDQERKVCVHL